MGVKKVIMMAVSAAVGHPLSQPAGGTGGRGLAMTEFQMRVSTLASCSLVTVWGALDATNGADFQKRLIAVVDEAEHAVIVDLQWLASMDASVVNTLLLARCYGRGKHVTVELAGARGRVAYLLRILGLQESLSLRADVYEAVRILQDRGLPQPHTNTTH